jgi:hypothetical protein
VLDLGPEAGAGGGLVVAEGPPEDIVIHAQRWRQQEKKASKGTGAGPADRLLRSHTGEALSTFGATPVP